jgi:hypothetical protein
VVPRSACVVRGIGLAPAGRLRNKHDGPLQGGPRGRTVLAEN